MTGAVTGYVDHPSGTPQGDEDAACLIGSGISNIRHEVDQEARTVWNEVDAGLRPGDILVVVSLDRLGRPLRRLLRSVASLSNRGVGLRTLNDGVDLTTTPQLAHAQTRVVDALLACVNAWEAKRSRKGRQTMAERGKRPGAYPKLVIDSADDVRGMLQRPGATRTSVAKQLGVSRTTLYRYLQQAGSTSSVDAVGRVVDSRRSA
jgi:DNA invertase Pin-like site-specific DNA recombinase